MAEIGTDIIKAKELLESGELVAIPTETVYGLAGNAFNEDAVTAIFKAKNRPSFDPLIVHVDNIIQAESLTLEIPESAKVLIDSFWPGPLTILLKRKSIISDLITSGLDTVALRCPNNTLTKSLLASIDFPLVAPSANPFGYVSPTTAQHVNDQLGDKIAYILDGGSCNVGIESTIVGFENNEVIVHRLGGVTVDDLEAIIGKVHVRTHSSSNPKAPGMLENHYSPTKTLVIGEINELLSRYSNKKIGLLTFSSSYDQEIEKVLAPDSELATAAKNLFSYLRWLDAQPIDIILAEKVPSMGLGMAINDRLSRAAAKRN